MAVRIPDARAIQPVGSPRDPGVGASAEDFGVGVGVQVSRLGGQIAEIADRTMARREAVANANAYIAAQAEIQKALDTMDFSADGAAEEFGSFVSQKTQEIYSATPGRLEAKARLQRNLMALGGEATARASGLAIEQGYAKVNESVDRQLSPLLDQVSRDATNLPAAMQQAEVIYENAAPAVPPSLQAAYRQNIRSQVANRALDGAFAAGNLDLVEELLSSDGGNLAAELSSEDLGRQRLQLTAHRASANQAEQQIRARMGLVREVFPDAPGSVVASLAFGVSLPSSTGGSELAAKVAAYRDEMRKVPGVPPDFEPSVDDVRKIAGLSTGGGDNPFDLSAAQGGDAMNVTRDMASDIASGAYPIGSTADFAWQNAVKKLVTPQIDPVTKLRIPAPGLPPYALEAEQLRVARGGRPIPLPAEGADLSPEMQQVLGGPAVTAPTTMVAQAPAQPGTAAPAPGGPSLLPPSATAAETPTTALPAPAAPSGTAPPAPERTLFQEAGGWITGPGGTFFSAWNALPVLGNLAPDYAQRVSSVRQELPNLQNDIVAVSQTSPVFAQRERESLKSELSVLPSLIDRADAYRGRIAAIDQIMAEGQRKAAERVAGIVPVGAEAQAKAQLDFDEITRIRKKLGVPPRFRNDAEVRQAIIDGRLKIGDPYIDGNFKAQVLDPPDG